MRINYIPRYSPGFIVAVTVPANTTVTIPYTPTYGVNFVVDWGDGSAQGTVTVASDPDASHTYIDAGTYDVRMNGFISNFNTTFNTAFAQYVVAVKQWGNCDFYYLSLRGCTNLASIPNGAITGVSHLTTCQSIFQNCTSLTFIPAHLFDNATVTTYFSYAFSGCTGLTSSIPADMFKYNTQVGDYGFRETFYGCTNLTGAIPVDLFRYNTLVGVQGFSNTFTNCYLLSSIPADLFRYNTLVSTNGFYACFMNCRAITSLPGSLFQYNTAVTSYAFNGTFWGCYGLTSIPGELFQYNTLASDYAFRTTFYGCTGLTSIPTDLFRYNTAASNNSFASTFYGCSNLASMPAGLFKYNTLATDFSACFQSCPKLTLNRNMFFDDGDEGTRFLNQSVNFTNCFTRTSFTGTQGEAPSLWNCDFGTGTPTRNACFYGNGNSATSLSNYASIPTLWINP